MPDTDLSPSQQNVILQLLNHDVKSLLSSTTRMIRKSGTRTGAPSTVIGTTTTEAPSIPFFHDSDGSDLTAAILLVSGFLERLGALVSGGGKVIMTNLRRILKDNKFHFKVLRYWRMVGVGDYWRHA